jgi:hypothetical protein
MMAPNVPVQSIYGENHWGNHDLPYHIMVVTAAAVTLAGCVQTSTFMPFANGKIRPRTQTGMTARA